MSDEIRKQNAKELRKAWKQFLKEQKAKHGHKTIIGDAEAGFETLDERATAHSI